MRSKRSALYLSMPSQTFYHVSLIKYNPGKWILEQSQGSESNLREVLSLAVYVSEVERQTRNG